MAQNSGSHSSPAGGYAQNSGGYYITTATIVPYLQNFLDGTGSGGATTTGTVSAYSWGSTGAQSSLVGSGRLIRDMGRHVISAGRCFRKFQAVNYTDSLSTSGVVGAAATTTYPGYLTFYLEMPKGGVGPNIPASLGAVAPIAKYS